jgi:1-acyl-sn-glycerol-3-phosphate acyltransferase
VPIPIKQKRLIYFLLHPFIRLAIKIFCYKIVVNRTDSFSEEGPILITANHPDSFLDAIIIAAYFKRPIHFLARGDAFNKPWHSVLLKTLHLFPVYRLSEGKENLGLNSLAFENSKKVLQQNGIVLIFIEGICLNKNSLQPFKKGAARIANQCWADQIPVRVLPIRLNYNSFSKFGKRVSIQVGNFLTQKDLLVYEEEAKNYIHFNQQVNQCLENLVPINISIDKPNAFFVPFGLIGKFLHLPFYRLIQKFVQQKTSGTVFYDSVLFGLLFLLYPFYLLMIALILGAFNFSTAFIIGFLILHPISAYFATKNRANEKSEANQSFH